MKTLSLSPLDPDFVQNPYAAYAAARADGPVMYWRDYAMPAAFDAATVQALLRDRRLGREVPEGARPPYPVHLVDWAAMEGHSMLELEPPRHTRLRGLVLRAFTSRRITALLPDIEEVTAELLQGLPKDPFDLIPAYCTELPVRIIARLLGVPETMSADLLRWSNAMVAMYQAGRSRAIEDAANSATAEFVDFLRGYVEKRRNEPRDDLITSLIAAEEDGEKLTPDELIGTCILLLNAGHEATVHSMGNAVKCLLEHQTGPAALAPDQIGATVEELLRYDPPLHMFTRFAYEDIELDGVTLKSGDEIALMLGAAARDPAVFENPDVFDPYRLAKPHAAFGGGLHFCVGAPLARMELQVALPALFEHLPQMSLAEVPRYAMSYHFHKLDRLMIAP
ncbi:cytochrome P450 [Sulfitobacter mediterraneus]|uniref:cytochrome P450 n=1 Tax=Sulfitobacter mediterraneus TaxID=83219 RepID=UPI001931B4A5|nr:cytochrome P450 [Sulfitobacter mediterraneus]MBM1631835.1 cytochrome P450 [Sulfitobacter mediterraneus]MBM1639650.1 cytochrome P450 [Sulfitobacter mediterraneus]MBM1643699.1 cytochrome P450 [Sulfitobacter mediterraneus]MBM1647745.1 cytochrome P450 [Sulfitobacter mediterraneus]MBM1651790.1 cytochrome P450 [Sulfitobacter mediterraneus]